MKKIHIIHEQSWSKTKSHILSLVYRLLRIVIGLNADNNVPAYFIFAKCHLYGRTCLCMALAGHCSLLVCFLFSNAARERNTTTLCHIFRTDPGLKSCIQNLGFPRQNMGRSMQNCVFSGVFTTTWRLKREYLLNKTCRKQTKKHTFLNYKEFAKFGELRQTNGWDYVVHSDATRASFEHGFTTTWQRTARISSQRNAQ